MATTHPSLPFEAPPEVCRLISTIGRTEDARFSPDGTRLALADYRTHCVFVFGVRIDPARTPSRIAIDGCSILSSPALGYPHGLGFMGNDHLVVANRQTHVAVFELPPQRPGVVEYAPKPVRTIGANQFLLSGVKAPGSVDCLPVGERYRTLVCNNYWHTVTSHALDLRQASGVEHHGILIEEGLRVPDGISISPDGGWIAISNHADGKVLLYRFDQRLSRRSGAVAAVGGMVCPHGLRFSRDGRRLFVADAASPYLHVVHRPEGGWGTAPPSMGSVRVLDDAAFYLGREDSREGGFKGIDVDPAGSVLVATRRRRALAFYDLDQLSRGARNADQALLTRLTVERDHSLAVQRGSSLEQRWSAGCLARVELARVRRGLARRSRQALAEARISGLHVRNHGSTEPILDPAGPVLTMTSHGARVKRVFSVIESIARGDLRPSRVFLWLEEEAYRDLPDTLRRLVRRGLEVRMAESLGPHTKYYPYVDSERDFPRPVVTADDDVLYPRHWLARLADAHEANPAAIHCHRARRMRLSHGRLAPYGEWDPCLGSEPSHANFVTGVSGAIYPPRFLEHLRNRGKAFEECCPANDDIWLTVTALRNGFEIAQVRDVPLECPAVPGSQRDGLFAFNVVAGNNHWQLLKTFSEADLRMLNDVAERQTSMAARG